jgi:hypothetical protein
MNPRPPGTGQAQNPLEAQQLAESFGLLGTMGGVSASGGMIYFGPDDGYFRGIPYARPLDEGALFTVSQANAAIWDWDKKQMDDFNDLVEDGTGSRPKTFEQSKQAWERMVGYAGSYSSDSGTPTSPFKIADMIAERSRNMGSPGSGGAGGGPSTTVYKDETVNLTNPSTARGVLDSALGKYLGRMPSPKEYKSFVGALTMAEDASPNTSERVTRNSGGTNQTITNKGKTGGGVDRNQFATEFAKSDEDFAETQLSTTGVQAFLGMLK